jgi:hypothetical protein
MNPFHILLGENLNEYNLQNSKNKLNKNNSNDTENRLLKKRNKSKNFFVNANNKVPILPQLDDLIRLHYLVTSRKVSTILEFGVGKSTLVFDHALTSNRYKCGSYVKENLRRSNPFECHSVDNSKKWIKEVKKLKPSKNVFIHFSHSRMGTFNGRVCTFYDKIPNICPDLIYLDGPNQFSTKGDVRGISTKSQDRLPMAGDILLLEHFLLPGTLIVVDGRAANARFLKSNLQRDWTYNYFEKYDQHFFELTETSLGKLNSLQMNLPNLIS